MSGDDVLGDPNTKDPNQTDTGGIPNARGQDYGGNIGMWSGPAYGERGYSTDANGNFIPDSDARGRDVARDRGLGAAAAAMTAPQLNYGATNASLGGAGQALTGANINLVNGSVYGRGAQEDSLSLARAAANGQAPSAAQSLQRNTLDQGFSQQLAAAASARGGAMQQAAAIRGAQQGAAGYYQQGANQIGALRAQEMAQARSDYGNQAGAIRQGDYNAAGVYNQTATGYNNVANSYGNEVNSQAALDMQQRGMNQQAQQFYENQAFNTNQSQLNADLQGAALAQGNRQFQAGVNMQNTQNTYNAVGAGLGGGATFGAAMINSGNNNGNNRATGGPVAGGQPYIVGERGPELIVPQHNGYVIPAGPTAAMMGGLGHAASRFGGYREEGGPVQPSTAYVAGEAGPEVIVPTSRELNAKGDAQGKTADEHAMRGIAQVFLPGQVAPGLVNMGRGIVGSGQAMRSYLQANDQRGREEAARPPVYVEQPPVTKQEARTAADVKAARLADEQLARDEAARQAAAAQQQSKLAAIYDYLFSKEPAAVAGVAAPSLAQAATQYRGDR